METAWMTVDDVRFIVPAFLVDLWPYHLRLADFPTFCGAGAGIGDMLVPESAWGLKLSSVCFIHDLSWAVAAATWAEFHQANTMMLYNTLRLIMVKSKTPLKQLRSYRAVTYFNAVDTFGADCFWSDKEELGVFQNPLHHPTVREKLERVGTFPALADTTFEIQSFTPQGCHGCHLNTP